MPKIIPTEHVDNWYWEAIYSDGTSLEELEDDGTLHGFREINQEKLTGFILRPLHPHLPQFAVQVNPGKRLIFFRKRKKILDMNTGEQYDAPPFQCIGFQETVNGRNVKSYLFVDVDGNSVLTDDHNAV
jgi:hypothetical protein